MHEKVYRTMTRTIEKLREQILNDWDELDQLVINAAIIWSMESASWISVGANGGHFEQKF